MVVVAVYMVSIAVAIEIVIAPIAIAVATAMGQGLRGKVVMRMGAVGMVWRERRWWRVLPLRVRGGSVSRQSRGLLVRQIKVERGGCFRGGPVVIMPAPIRIVHLN